MPLTQLRSVFRQDRGVRTARFEQLRTEFAANWPADRDDAARKPVEQVLGPGPRETPAWADLFHAEVAMILHLPPAALRLKHNNLKDEYAATAGSGLAAAYFARLADPTSCDEATTRNEATDMLAQIQRMRVTRHGFNDMRWRLTMIGTSFTIVFCLLMVAYWSIVTKSGEMGARIPLKFATTTLALTGVLGGCISALSRLYSISWTGEMALTLDELGHTSRGIGLNVVLSMLEGGIFAMLLYTIFASGMVEGTLFPRFKSDSGTTYFHEHLEKGLVHHVDYAKAIVWAFIAGFSERLVPDFLNSLRSHLTVTAKK